MRLLAAPILWSSLAPPSWLWSQASAPASTPHLSAAQDKARDNERQAAASQSSDEGKDRRNGIHPLPQPRPLRNGDGPQQGNPERPDTRPLPGAPHQGGSPGKPGQPSNRPPRGPRPVRPPRPNAPRPPRGHYPPHYAHGYPHYEWGIGNGWRLRQYFYPDMRREHWMYRHPIQAGGYLSPWLLANIRPIPWELMSYLPPVPPGFEAGYINGYCLVYDQDTLRVIAVIDLREY